MKTLFELRGILLSCQQFRHITWRIRWHVSVNESLVRRSNGCVGKYKLTTRPKLKDASFQFVRVVSTSCQCFQLRDISRMVSVLSQSWQYGNVKYSFVRSVSLCAACWRRIYSRWYRLVDAKRCAASRRQDTVAQTNDPLLPAAKWKIGTRGSQCRPSGDHQTKLYILTCCKLHTIKSIY